MSIACSTARKQLTKQGIHFSQNGYGLCDFDWLGNSIDIYYPDGTKRTESLWNAYCLIEHFLYSGDRLANDGTTILNYYALQQIFEGLVKE